MWTIENLKGWDTVRWKHNKKWTLLFYLFQISTSAWKTRIIVMTMPRVQIMKEVSPANVSKVTQVMVQIVQVSRQKYLLSYWRHFATTIANAPIPYLSKFTILFLSLKPLLNTSPNPKPAPILICPLKTAKLQHLSAKSTMGVFIIMRLLKYCLINEQECFIRFKATSAQREWL